MKNIPVFLACLILLCGISVHSLAGQGDLKKCQKLADKIEKYDDLRSGGGNAARMERWKKSRRKYKEKFKSLKCSKWKRKFE